MKKHAIKVIKKKYDFEKFICLPVTSPLRSNNDIIKCINKYYKSDMIIAIQKTERNPWFNMVKTKNKNFFDNC